MKINRLMEDGKITLQPEGFLDTANSEDFGKAVDEVLETSKDLTIDFSKVEYISSSGLRILLKAQKRIYNEGKMVLTNVKDSVQEVFDITGFTDILTIV